MFKKIALCLWFALFLGLLSACSPSGLLRLNETESKPENTPSSEPKSGTENTKNSALKSSQEASSSIGAPVALPPQYGQNPPKPGETNTLYTPNGLPALQPMKGMNIDQVFSEEIRDSDDRFKRVENAVIEMRKEFDSLKPSIVRLAAVEADIQNLIKEMEGMLQETPPMQTNSPPDEVVPLAEPTATLQVQQLDPQPPPLAEATPLPPPEPANITEEIDKPPEEPPKLEQAQAQTQTTVPPLKQDQAPKVVSTPPLNTLKLPTGYDPNTPLKAPTKTPQEKPTQAKPTQDKKPDAKASTGTSIRFGNTDAAVRVVIETAKQPAYSLDLDNDEKLIVLELPDTKWSGAMKQTVSDSPLFESYEVESTNDGRGSMIIFTLKKRTEIQKQSILKPDGKTQYRLYFDLKR